MSVKQGRNDDSAASKYNVFNIFIYHMEDVMTKNFEGLLSKVNECETKKLAVAVAQDRPVLEAVKLAKERKIADAILVGDEDQIRAIGAEIGMNMDE